MSEINVTKLLEVLDVQAGKFRETVVQTARPANLTEAVPYPRGKYGELTVNPERVDRALTEAAMGGMATSNFPDLLRLGVQFDVFSGYNETPSVYERLVKMVPSNKHQEEYADDEGLGLAPVVSEGEDYPRVSPSIGGGTIIKNHKRGFIIEVTEELMRFDQLGKVRDTANAMGRALRMTRNQEVLNVLTTTTNYAVKNLNDQAASNTQTLTFTPTNLNTALALMMTQKDRKSGQYLGVMPSVLVVGPLLERFAKMLISSPELMRQGGPTTSEVYGAGSNNPFFGVVSQVIVSPMFGASYQWALLDPFRAIYFQEVEGPRVEVEGTMMSSESWLGRDVIRYKCRDWYGVGMRDDRYAFYSDSTTAPEAS